MAVYGLTAGSAPGQTWVNQFIHTQVPALQPQILLVNDIESITPSGTTPTTGNSGSATSNAFDGITVGSGASLVSDLAHAAHGLYGLRVQTGATSTQSFAGWTTSMGQQQTVWFRVYLYFTAIPAGSIVLFRAVSNGVQAGGMRITTTGKIAVVNGAGSNVATSATTIPLNQWFRVEGFITGHATAGQLEARLFTSSQDSTVVTEIVNPGGAAQATTGLLDTYEFGCGTSVANAAPFWIDDVGISNYGYIGPASGTPQVFPATFANQAVPGQIWLNNFRHPNYSVNPVYPLNIPLPGSTANVSVTATFPDIFAGATGPNIISQAYPGQTWTRYYEHTQQAYGPLPIYMAPITVANITVAAPSDQPLTVTITGVTANITVGATGVYAGAIGPSIVSQAYPGQTWTRQFEHTQQPYPPLTPTQIVTAVVSNINVAAPSDQPLSVNLTGTVANINVGATFSDTFAGAIGPNIVSTSAPGQTWTRYYEHTQQAYGTLPIYMAPVANANINVNAPSDQPLSVNIAGVVATSNVNATYSDIFAGAIGPNIVSQAYPGQTWIKQFVHTQQPYPPLTPTYIVTAVVSNITVNAPSDQPLSVSVTGTTATININATFSDIFAGAVGPFIVSEYQPGQTWTRQFVHQQIAFPNLAVPPPIISGSVASISVTAQSGTIAAGPVTGPTALISSGIDGSVNISVSALSAVTVGGIAGGIANTTSGPEADISVNAYGGIVSLPTTVTGTIAAISVRAPVGQMGQGMTGSIAAISVAGIPGGFAQSYAGVTANIIVVSNAGQAGSVVISGDFDAQQWGATLLPISSGFVIGTWTGDIDFDDFD